jgi:hypothetical protein
MKTYNIKIIIAILIAFAPYKAMAGGIDITKLRLGGGIYYQNPYGDMDKYWNASPGIGINGTYQISGNVILEGGIYGSYFKTKENHAYPDFYIFHMPASLKIKIIGLGSSLLFISPGLANNTFYFTGAEAENLDNNNMESEFGLFLETSLQIPVFQSINIEPFVKYQTIFSSPINIDILYAGVKVFTR